MRGVVNTCQEKELNLFLFIHDARERLLESRLGLLSDSMRVVEFHQSLLELDLKTIEEFLLELFWETILPMYQILLIDLVVWERLVARKNFLVVIVLNMFTRLLSSTPEHFLFRDSRFGLRIEHVQVINQRRQMNLLLCQ